MDAKKEAEVVNDVTKMDIPAWWNAMRIWLSKSASGCLSLMVSKESMNKKISSATKAMRIKALMRLRKGKNLIWRTVV